jgi:hypothetical protein
VSTLHSRARYGYVKTTAYSYYYDLVLPFFDTMNKLGVVTNRSEVCFDIDKVNVTEVVIRPPETI